MYVLRGAVLTVSASAGLASLHLLAAQLPAESDTMRRRRSDLASLLGWGLMLVLIAYLWLFVLVSISAAH